MSYRNGIRSGAEPGQSKSERMSKEVSEPPERIWLQWYGEDAPLTDPDAPVDLGEVCWCQDSVFDTDIEYVRVKKRKRG